MGEGADRAGAARARLNNSAPITLLIAALGGEGGGVLTNWIVRAAETLNFPGAEHVDPRRRPAHRRDHLLHRDAAGCRANGDARQPILALAPGVGDVDVMVASELMEAGRAVSAGFVTPDRTLVHRVHLALLCDGREDRDGRRPLRFANA